MDVEEVNQSKPGQEEVNSEEQLIDLPAFESEEDSTSSSSDSSEDPIDEEVVLSKLLDVPQESSPAAKAKKEVYYLHDRLGTLHMPNSTKVERLACGKVISLGFKKIHDAKFSWMRCLRCFPDSDAI